VDPAAAAPGLRDRERLVLLANWAASTSAATAASSNLVFWKVDNGWPKTWREATYSTAAPSAARAWATEPTAIVIRSCGRLRPR
jgi:hypothetical protein